MPTLDPPLLPVAGLFMTTEQQTIESFLKNYPAIVAFMKKNPNIQNIPIRTPEGQKIREAFKSKRIVAIDYSEFEKKLIQHFKESK